MFKKLSDRLKALMEATTLFANVYDFEASDLAGTPVCTITPSGNVSNYDTTTENRRRYAFMVRLYVERKSGNDNEKESEEAMKELCDAVVDTLDANHQLPGLVSQTGYTFLFMRASPSRWGYAGRENNYRVAEIEMLIDFHIDVNEV